MNHDTLNQHGEFGSASTPHILRIEITHPFNLPFKGPKAPTDVLCLPLKAEIDDAMFRERLSEASVSTSWGRMRQFEEL